MIKRTNLPRYNLPIDKHKINIFSCEEVYERLPECFRFFLSCFHDILLQLRWNPNEPSRRKEQKTDTEEARVRKRDPRETDAKLRFSRVSCSPTVKIKSFPPALRERAGVSRVWKRSPDAQPPLGVGLQPLKENGSRESVANGFTAQGFTVRGGGEGCYRKEKNHHLSHSDLDIFSALFFVGLSEDASSRPEYGAGGWIVHCRLP